MNVLRWVEDFIGLIFPRICIGCGNNLWRYEELLCQMCEFTLPRTMFHLDRDNPVARLLWGRADIVFGMAFLFFNKGSKVQHIIHALKYKGKKEVGIYLGKRYGMELKNCGTFNSWDCIIPIPLHRKKLIKRGYNQSDLFAAGLSESLGIPAVNTLLARIRANDTQTRKSRFGRYQNVKEIFSLNDPGCYEGKHLLLVDDVITTGATLESCIIALQKIPSVRISVACIASAV